MARERAEQLLESAASGLAGAQVETTLVAADDVVDAIVAESNRHALTIIGATREGLLQRILFRAIPEAVGRRAGNTVVMRKRHLDVPSRLRDLLRWR